jgi:hypothetical protein
MSDLRNSRDVVGIPPVVKPVGVPVPPVAVAIEIQNVTITVGMLNMYRMPSISLLLEACAISKLSAGVPPVFGIIIP